MHDQGFLLPLYCSVKFHVHFHPQVYLSQVPAQQYLLLSLASFGKEKSAVFIVLDVFGNMHYGVQDQPKKQGHVQGKGKGREDTLLGAAV